MDCEKLIENLSISLQPTERNCLEMAITLQSLLREKGWTQDELAVKIGMNRSTLANHLRLLCLPPAIQKSLSEGVISMGHAKALLSISDSKKQLFIYSSLFGVVANIALYIIGRVVTHGTMQVEAAAGLYLCIGFLFLTSLSGGFHTILETAMIGDSVDYLEWKTGVRAEGLCYSGQTFVTKLVSALCSFVFGLMLSANGYINTNAAAQPLRALDAIFASVSIWPAIGCALSILPILWYAVDDRTHKKYIDEINARKALAERAD